MKPYEVKPSVADSSYPPPLADDRNIQPRLHHLSNLLEQITERLVDCTFAAKALGYVEAAIRLELINFDVMKDVCMAMPYIQFCNTLRTQKEDDASELVKEAFDLANDILLDLPLGLGHGGITLTLPDFDVNESKRYQIVCDNSAASQESAEEESLNLAPISDDTLPVPYAFQEGDKVSLLRDLPDETSPLFAGDKGEVKLLKGFLLGVCFERYGYEQVSVRRMVDGEKVLVLDFCTILEEEGASND
jgi:hypothetical protein